MMAETKRWTEEQREAQAERMRAVKPWERSSATGRGPRRRFVHEALHAALARFLPTPPAEA
jgi:hypothetical protein